MPAHGSSSAVGAPTLRGYRRRWPRRVLVLANVAVAAVLVVTVGSYAYVQFQFSKITHVSIPGIFPVGKSRAQAGSDIAPFTLLAVGSDSRDIAGGQKYEGGSSTSVQGARSDSIVLIRVNPAARAVALLSIPRDSIVAVPGMGMTRINSAFNASTPDLLIKVLDQDYGIQVNHFAEANFDTFQQLADAVGGVNMWFPTPAMDPESLMQVGAGCQNLNGPLALAFVRSRNYFYRLDGQWQLQQDPESDLARIQRQQAFIKLALQKAREVAPTDITKLNGLVSSVTGNLTLDSTFSNGELLDLADRFRSANLGDIAQYTYPTTNSTEVEGALDPDFTAGAAVVRQWLDVGESATTPTATTAPTPTPAAPPTTTVSPSSITVEVANGSGVAGQAAAASSALSSLGYSTTVSTLRYPSSLSSSLVLYAPDSLADARQVQAELQGGATVEEDSALTQSPYNVEVVTGSAYRGVAGVAASVPTSTSSTTAGSTTTVEDPALTGSPTVTPSSSSYVAGQYVPPGLEPGQAVGHCTN